ncbi:capsule assembly Wzi family protein, partial [bacterium]|nr:capsule assembly Wzi family protein [bacterium]
MKKVILFVLIVFSYPIFVTASLNQTLPSWHWAYDYIDELRLRGCCETLYSLNRPYTRGEVAEAIIRSQERLGRGELSLSVSDRRLLERLVEEFQEEMKNLQEKPNNKGSYEFGIRLQSDLDRQNEGGIKYRGIYRTKLGVSLGTHIAAYNGINFDQYLVDDSLYVGKKWRGIVGYTEQAYVSVHFNRIRLMFGRDFLYWGAGENGSLLFSNMARPMDQLKVTGRLGPFQYTFITS